MAGFCIVDDEACCEASEQEIIHYYQALNRLAKEEGNSDEVYKINLLMKKANIDVSMRRVIGACLERAERSPAVSTAAMELEDGTIVTGKTSPL